MTIRAFVVFGSSIHELEAAVFCSANGDLFRRKPSLDEPSGTGKCRIWLPAASISLHCHRPKIQISKLHRWRALGLETKLNESFLELVRMQRCIDFGFRGVERKSLDQKRGVVPPDPVLVILSAFFGIYTQRTPQIPCVFCSPFHNDSEGCSAQVP